MTSQNHPPAQKIFLASASPQRRKLLRRLGLKFRVAPSRIRELKTIRGGCARLVQENALRKAVDIARTKKEGIIIGADTLVYDGKGIVIGKPRHLPHAKKILKRMAASPHWVYTGLAVIDAGTGRCLVGYEKTKIYMDRLTDEEIDRYHAHVSPLDKAGGFDIEGKGGLFIKKIEGCYYNVIGLPLAKLCAMLKKIGVHALMLALIVNVAGCATEYNLATQQEESLLYGTDKEVKIGDAVAAQFDAHFTINTDIDVNERVEDILDRITTVADRKDIVYIIKVIEDSEQVNAVSLPGGYVYVFTGLIDRVKNDVQLAAVIAHEVGHITAKHGIKRLQAQYGYLFLQALAIGTGQGQAARGIELAFLTAFTEYSQEDELQADRLAVQYMKKAGYDPHEVANMLRVLKEHQDKQPAGKFSYWRTHPHIPQRIAVVNKEITGQLKFEDYLNLTGDRGDLQR